LLVPLVKSFQTSFPEVRIQLFISERFIDHIADGIDLAFRVGEQLKDSLLVARRLLTYRHQLVASPAYLENYNPLRTPQDLLNHRLFSFLRRGKAENSWRFTHVNGKERETINFLPSLAMNDYVGLASALLDGRGIGDLPPIVQPQLLRDERLVEVLSKWHFRTVHLWLVHLGNRHTPRMVRVFKDFAAETVPKLFPNLPN
jgi:DNA-binding transcriptional LysR family regulator